MSKNLIDKMFSIIDNRDFSRLSEVFCDDIIYERPGYEPLYGITELIDFYQNIRIIAEGEHLVDEIISEKSRGSCWGTFAGKNHQGKALNARFSDCYTFEQEKVKTRATYFFKAEI
jgi:ketosteroid isomerase-like protein